METHLLRNCFLNTPGFNKPPLTSFLSNFKSPISIKFNSSKVVRSRCAKRQNNDYFVKNSQAPKEDEEEEAEEEEEEEELEKEAILMGEDGGREPDDYNRRAHIFDTCSKVFLGLHRKQESVGEEVDTTIHSIPFDY